MKHPRPKVLFVDWFLTLSDSLFWFGMEDKSHPYHQAYPRLRAEFWGSSAELFNSWMRGQIGYEEACKKLGEKVGAPSDMLVEELKTSCKAMQFVDARVPELLGEIRARGVKIAVASDNMEVFREFVIPSMGLEKIFDGFLISNELGCLKKDTKNGKPLFWERFLEQNGFSPTEAMMLDDNAGVCEICAKAGMRVTRIDSSKTLVNTLTELAGV